MNQSGARGATREVLAESSCQVFNTRFMFDSRSWRPNLKTSPRTHVSIGGAHFANAGSGRATVVRTRTSKTSLAVRTFHRPALSAPFRGKRLHTRTRKTEHQFYRAAEDRCIACTHGSFSIRRQRGRPGVILQLVVSNSASH